MKKIFFTTLLVVMMLLSTVGMAAAITDGDPDGEGHPFVGLLIFDVDGEPGWRCSGTLIAPDVVLTAGHCTDGATGGRIWFESNLQGHPELGYPTGGPTSIEFTEIATHPQFHEGSFVLHDVGLVRLATPVDRGGFGTLPTAGQFDGIKTGKKTTFTAVGYGLQAAFPDATDWKESRLRTRMVAKPWLIMADVPGFTGPFSFLLSNNHSSGGTCFGDSGGPNFLGNSNLVAAVTSYGINSTCAGTGGVFRLDKQDVLDFIYGFMAE